MTETTEKISTADLVLLAGVMGWRRVDQFQTTQNGDFYVYLHEDTVRVLQDKVIEFAPTRDTAEGLWQAKQLVEAWCEQVPRRYWTVRADCDTCEVQLMETMAYGQECRGHYAAATLSEAIVRAVLAAVKEGRDA